MNNTKASSLTRAYMDTILNDVKAGRSELCTLWHTVEAIGMLMQDPKWAENAMNLLEEQYGYIEP